MSTVEKSAVSRRKVAAGIAWSVPAIALASAAPFAAALGECAELLTPNPGAPSNGGCSGVGGKLLTEVQYNGGNVIIKQNIHLLLPASVTTATQQDRVIELTFRMDGVSGNTSPVISLSGASGNLQVATTAVPLGNNSWDIKLTLTIPAGLTVARDTQLTLTITLSALRVVGVVTGALGGLFLNLRLTGFKTFGNDSCPIPGGLGSVLRIPGSLLAGILSTVSEVLTGGVRVCLNGSTLYFSL